MIHEREHTIMVAPGDVIEVYSSDGVMTYHTVPERTYWFTLRCQGMWNLGNPTALVAWKNKRRRLPFSGLST